MQKYIPPKYPYFVEKKSEFKLESHFFIGSYMTDSDVNTIHTLFPDGCSDDIPPSIYNIYIDNITINDQIQNLRDKISQEKIGELYDKIRALEKTNECLFWNFHNRFFEGYYLLFDKDLKLVCAKGKTKPNKHTKIILLKKVPEKIQSLWDQLVTVHINPMIEIVKEYIDDSQTI